MWRDRAGIAKLLSTDRMQPDPSSSVGHLAGMVGPEAECISPCMTIGLGGEAITEGSEDGVELIMGGKEAFCLPGRLESPHGLLPPSHPPVAAFDPVVEPPCGRGNSACGTPTGLGAKGQQLANAPGARHRLKGHR